MSLLERSVYGHRLPVIAPAHPSQAPALGTIVHKPEDCELEEPVKADDTMVVSKTLLAGARVPEI